MDQLNAGKPLCPVGLNTLVVPRRVISDGSLENDQPFVYLNCGHVQGHHSWGQEEHSDSKCCSLCFEVSFHKKKPIQVLTLLSLILSL